MRSLGGLSPTMTVSLRKQGDTEEADAQENLCVMAEAEVCAVQLQAKDTELNVPHQRLGRGETSRIPEGEGPWDSEAPPSLLQPPEL